MICNTCPRPERIWSMLCGISARHCKTRQRRSGWQELIEAGHSILTFPYANPVHMPIRPLKHEYRKLRVRNYLMLYWVDEERKLVTIACVVYARRNYEGLL